MNRTNSKRQTVEDPVRLGCVGLGEVFAIRHLPVLQEERRVEVVAVADVQAEALQQTTKQLGCAGTDDWRELLTKFDIDALLICTPHHLHSEPAVAALQAGKHVLVEKPMAPTVEECQLMVQAARASDAVLMVAENYFYMPALQKMAALVEEGAIGEVTGLRLLQANPSSYPPAGHWRWSAQAGGGVMLDPGVHLCALAGWWGGPVQRVWADMYYPPDPGREVENSAEAVVDCGEGVRGQITVNWRAGAVGWRYEIQGSEGVMLYEYYRGAVPARLRLVNQDSCRDFEIPPAYLSPHSYQQEWDDFLCSITEKRSPGYPGERGLVDVAVVRAAYKSYETGTWVEVTHH